MKTKEFIEKANSGGYITLGKGKLEMFTDPKAWEAVGKVSGWLQPMPSKYDFNDDIAEWQDKMYGMIDALIEGKTIEEYIETL